MSVTTVNTLEREFNVTPDGEKRQAVHEITVTLPFPRDGETNVEMDSYTLDPAVFGLSHLEGAEIEPILEGPIGAEWDPEAGSVRVTKLSDPEPDAPTASIFRITAIGPPEFSHTGR